MMVDDRRSSGDVVRRSMSWIRRGRLHRSCMMCMTGGHVCLVPGVRAQTRRLFSLMCISTVVVKGSQASVDEMNERRDIVHIVCVCRLM